MALPPKQDVLASILPAWHGLLRDWSASGRLTRAAEEALVLNGDPVPLQTLVQRWAAADFSDLPPIVLLSACDIGGAIGAYAIGTGTIYLNQDWLRTASPGQVNGVLTEELGHYLDGILNAVDTPGDEGEFFENLLRGVALTSAKKQLLRTASDRGTITVGGTQIRSEFALAATQPSVSVAAIASGNDRTVSPAVFNFKRTGETSNELLVAYDLYGTDPQGDLVTAVTRGEIAIAPGSSSTTLAVPHGFTDYMVPINVTIAQSSNYEISPDQKTATTTIPFLIDNDKQKFLNYSRLGGYYGTTDDDTGSILDITFSGQWLTNNVLDEDRLRYAIIIDKKEYLSVPFLSTKGLLLSPEKIAQDFFARINTDKSYIAALSGATVYIKKAAGGPITASAVSTAAIYSTMSDSYGKTITDKSRMGLWDRLNPPRIAIGADTLSPGLLVTGEFREGTTLAAAATTFDAASLSVVRFARYNWYKDGVLVAKDAGNTYSIDSAGAGNYRVTGVYLRSDSSEANAETLVPIAKVNNGSGTLAAIKGNGPLTEGVTLVAGTVSGDPDGTAADPAYSYQWYLIRYNTAYTIDGATTANYTVGAQGSGAYMVAVSYTDGQGYRSTLNSAILDVSVADNGQGSLSAIIGTTGNEGDTLSAGTISGDPDGNGTINTYQWYLGSNAIVGATGSTYTVAASGTGNYTVAVTYTDGQGSKTTLTSASKDVAKMDNGTASFSVSGNAVVGQNLTALKTQADPDGDGAFTYQWQSSSNGGKTWNPIATATAASYKVAANDQGSQLRVAVTYTDGQAYQSTLTTTGREVVKVDQGQGTLSAISGNVGSSFNEGVILAAGTITGDPDGNGRINAYQWSVDGKAISGATASTYAIGPVGAGSYSVAVTYTDGQGNTSTLNSGSKAVVKVDNGKGTLSAITGNGATTFKEGDIIAAGTITGDPDGNGTVNAYQWSVDGKAINGATASTYTVGPLGAGSYSVAVTYTDGQGNKSTLNSAGQAVAKADNGKGALSAITGNAGATFNEGVTLTAGTISGDPDGNGTITGYQWYLGSQAIPGATASTYKVGPVGAGTYSVAVTYTDGQGNKATLTSAGQAVAKVNDGTASFSVSGNAVVGQTLTAVKSQSDPDGDGVVTYQWQSISNGGKSWNPIASATGSSYQVVVNDQGSQLRAVVSYTDGQGFPTSVVSLNATAPVPDTIPPTVSDISVNGNQVVVTFSEKIQAIAPITSPFAIKVAGVSRKITSLQFDSTSGLKLTFNLSGAAPSANQSLTLSTTGSPVIKDLAGNALGAISNAPATTFVASSSISSLAADYFNLLLAGNASIDAVGNSKNNTIVGNSGANVLSGGAGADSLTGGLGSDRFVYNQLSDSFLGTPGAYGFDRITDFAIGSDQLDGPTTLGASQIKKLGAVASLEPALLSAFLKGKDPQANAPTFAANGAALFSFPAPGQTRTFLALNDATQGFDASKDAIIEITGYTGDLNNLTIA